MAQPSLGVSLWFYKHESIPTTYSAISLSIQSTIDASGEVDAAYREPPAAATAGWKRLADIIDISFDGPTATDIATKHLGSAAYHATFKRGFRDPGTLTAKANFVDSQLGRLLYLYKDYVYTGASQTGTCYETSERLWELRIPDDDCGGLYHRYTFGGYLKTMGLEAPEDDRIVQSLEIKISGIAVYTPATGTTVLDGVSSGSSFTARPGTAIS